MFMQNLMKSSAIQKKNIDFVLEKIQFIVI